MNAFAVDRESSEVCVSFDFNKIKTSSSFLRDHCNFVCFLMCFLIGMLLNANSRDYSPPV